MKNAFSYCLPERAFFLRRAFVSHLLWMFFYSYDVCVLVYNRACCRRESSDIYRHRTASRAKQSTAQGSKPAQGAKHVRAYQSATTQQASRQSWLEPAYRRAFIVKALVRWATGKRAGVMHERFAYKLLFSPSYLFRPCMRRQGCFRGPWSSWHLQIVSLNLKPWTSLSASFTHILFIYSL